MSTNPQFQARMPRKVLEEIDKYAAEWDMTRREYIVHVLIDHIRDREAKEPVINSHYQAFGA